MNIFKEKPMVISKEAIWVGIHTCYLYTHSSLVGLLWIMLTEWKHDKHLVG